MMMMMIGSVQSKPVFVIGAHKLEGEIVKLRRPMLVMKKGAREGSSPEASFSCGGEYFFCG